MRTLRLIGLSPDSSSVVFTDDAGVEYAAPADDRMRAALRGDRARLGQLEIDMESALRPRNIQARIRAGEAPEDVAALAGVPVERIMAYCVPVLAERRHVADLASRCHVRRANADGTTRVLEAVVAERLRGRGISPDSADWDAWRRDDGRWTVQVSYHSGERLRSASFVFDQAGRYSLADDDEAKWLTGERQQTRKGPQPRESGKSEAGRVHDRRLSAVPTGDDLLTLSEAQVDLDGWIDRMEPGSASASRQPDPDEVYDREADLDVGGELRDHPDEPVEDTLDDTTGDGGDQDDTEPVPGRDLDGWTYADDEATDVSPDVTDDLTETTDDLTAVVRAVREAGAPDDAPAAADQPAAPPDAPPAAPPDAAPQRRRRVHAAVPSWDEIMLGGRSRER